MITVCQKGQRRCPCLLEIREEALAEWCRAQTYSDVCRAWARLGGRVTLHRYGRGWYALLGRRRWGKIDKAALESARPLG